MKIRDDGSMIASPQAWDIEWRAQHMVDWMMLGWAVVNNLICFAPICWWNMKARVLCTYIESSRIEKEKKLSYQIWGET